MVTFGADTGCTTCLDHFDKIHDHENMWLDQSIESLSWRARSRSITDSRNEINHELAFERTKYEPQSSERSYYDLQVTNNNHNLLFMKSWSCYPRASVYLPPEWYSLVSTVRRLWAQEQRKPSNHYKVRAGRAMVLITHCPSTFKAKFRQQPQ